MPRTWNYKRSIECTSQYGSVSTRTVTISSRSWSGSLRRRRPKGVSVTPCTSTMRKENGEVFTVVMRNGTKRTGTLAFAYNSEVPKTVTTEPSEQDGINARAAAARKFGANSGLGETVAELPQSLRHASRRIDQFYNFARLAGKGKFRLAGDLLKAATGYNVSNRSVKRLEKKFSEAKAYDSRRASAAWLEWSFGIAPLLQSISDSLEVFSRKESQTYGRTGSVNGAKFGIRADIGNQSTFTARSLGVTSPAEILWALQPWSFVIDWFMPVSNTLRYLAAKRGLSRVVAWRSTESKRVITIRGIWHSDLITYNRFSAQVPGTLAQFRATARDFGLWHVITSLTLIDGLR